MSTLLIADDERTIREGIASAIDWKSLGVTEVFLAATGKKAFAMIQAQRPDIAIVDIVMPEMTGIELIKKCRELPESPEFVIISGHDDFTYAQEALRYQVRDFILKPCDIVEISATIRGIVQELAERRSMEVDRRRMREQLDVLAPQARKALFRDLLCGMPVSEADLQTLRLSLGPKVQRFQLLLFVCESETTGDRNALSNLLDDEPTIRACFTATIKRDCVAVLLGTEKRASVVEAAETLRARVTSFGYRVAVSAPGELAQLPCLFLVAYGRMKRAVRADDTAGKASVAEMSPVPYSPPVLHVMRFVNERFGDNGLSLGMVAGGVLGMNADYVGKLFRRECGMSFSEYVMAVRIEHAKRILGSSESARIYQAASQTGFGDDAAYFSRVFREQTGMKPGDYRGILGS